jgi:hypothetical protein
MDFRIRILRVSTNDHSLTGELFVDGRFLCHTLELPYLGNASFISSIPSNTYTAFLRYDNADQWRIQLQDVPGRTGIQIHVGNYPAEIQGCVLVGDVVENGANRILSSQGAYDRLKTSFYGSAIPSATPNKEISVELAYSNSATEYVDGNYRLVHRRDLSYIYFRYNRLGGVSVRIPLQGGGLNVLAIIDDEEQWITHTDFLAVFTRRN